MPIPDMKFSDLTIKIFADCGFIPDTPSIINNRIAGFTTNPTILSNEGLGTGYYYLCQRLAEDASPRPISLEVLASSPREIIRQSKLLAGFGDNVYVKIPVVSDEGVSLIDTIVAVSALGIKVNVTAVMTFEQVNAIVLPRTVPSIVSIFAGRIADTGRDPVPLIRDARRILKVNPLCEILWASTREPYNIIQAQDAGCDIITVSPDILAKAQERFGASCDELSVATVRQFTKDAEEANFRL